MKVFLCGGGAGDQTARAITRLNQVIDHTKPCLYIPLAMEACQYDGCREWIAGELKDVDIPHIKMVRSAVELAKQNLADYSMLFIGGGNTFKLLSELKASGAFVRIKEYLERDGVVFGGSAGAIIFGEDLESCRLDDANEVDLTDTAGFDILNGISLLCHYTNRSPEKDAQNREYLLELSKRRRILALPEEVTLFVNRTACNDSGDNRGFVDTVVEVIGDRPYYYFENGSVSEKRAVSDKLKLPSKDCLP